MSACALCGGDLSPLGMLGARLWARCRRCGIDVRLPDGAREEWEEE